MGGRSRTQNAADAADADEDDADDADEDDADDDGARSKSNRSDKRTTPGAVQATSAAPPASNWHAGVQSAQNKIASARNNAHFKSANQLACLAMLLLLSISTLLLI